MKKLIDGLFFYQADKTLIKPLNSCHEFQNLRFILFTLYKHLKQCFCKFICLDLIDQRIVITKTWMRIINVNHRIILRSKSSSIIHVGN